MESAIITFLLILVVTALVWWVVHRIPIPAPVMNVAEIIIVVVAVLALIGLLTGHHLIAWKP